jgi:hypothetical protein
VRSTAAAEAKKTEAAAKTDSADEPIATALKMDDLKVELGYECAGQQRSSHRANQGFATFACGRDGICHARRPHSRQRAA